MARGDAPVLPKRGMDAAMTKAGLATLETERLVLRPRTPADLDAVMALNADPAVMAHIAAPGDPAMGREAVAARSFAHLNRGLGYWTVQRRDAAGDALGYVGLIPDGPDGEDVQLSYRFAARHWGQGYALEAASRLVRHGFETLALAAIGIVTHPANAASLRLGERLGFTPAAPTAAATIGFPPVAATHLRRSRSGWLAENPTPPAA